MRVRVRGAEWMGGDGRGWADEGEGEWMGGDGRVRVRVRGIRASGHQGIRASGHARLQIIACERESELI